MLYPLGNHIVFGAEKERKIGQKLTYFFSLFSLFWGKYKKGFKVCEYFEEEIGGGGRAYLRPNWAANFYSLAARDCMRHGAKNLGLGFIWVRLNI